MPHRIQLQRRRGWRMPANTVKVDRSTRWGNPFRIDAERSRADSVDAFRAYCEHPDQTAYRRAVREHLRGLNLACWCPPDGPCHAEVLLEIAKLPDDAAP